MMLIILMIVPKHVKQLLVWALYHLSYRAALSALDVALIFSMKAASNRENGIAFLSTSMVFWSVYVISSLSGTPRKVLEAALRRQIALI